MISHLKSWKECSSGEMGVPGIERIDGAYDRSGALLDSGMSMAAGAFSLVAGALAGLR